MHNFSLFFFNILHNYSLGSALATPTLIGVIDSYGIELHHPVREGRSPKQLDKKGKSNKRWIVGGKLCYVLNRFGLIVR